METKKNKTEQMWIQTFFAVAAISWMPHLSCHYYRLETGSTFILGNLNFSVFASILFMAFYLVLIIINIAAITQEPIRFIGAISSGIFHISFGLLHIIRLIIGFNFEVFGYEWSMGSSLREILFVLPFGIICILISIKVRQKVQLS